jgi:hypothetical protein
MMWCLLSSSASLLLRLISSNKHSLLKLVFFLIRTAHIFDAWNVGTLRNPTHSVASTQDRCRPFSPSHSQLTKPLTGVLGSRDCWRHLVVAAGLAADGAVVEQLAG